MSTRNKFKNMTIKRRFTTSALTVVIITMLLFEIIRIIMLTVSINKDVAQKVETTTKLTALSFVDPIWNLNVEGIKEISDALFQDKEIGYILVKAEGCGEIYNKYKTGEAYDNKNLIIKKIKVLKDDLTIGEVNIGITNYYRIKSLQNYIATTIISILVMIVVLWSAINFVSRIVTKSIYDLSLGTDEISNGNLAHRLSVDSADEIGELASKFNSMTKNLYNMIEERDEAIKALGASEEKFNKAFNYSADVIVIIRQEDKQYIEINEAFLRIFGYKREEIIGYTSIEIGLWENEYQYLKVWEEFQNGSLLRNRELAWYTKDGKIRVGLMSNELIDICGVPCVIFVWTDITERKQAEEALQRAHYQLENKVNERTKQLQETLMKLEKQHIKLKSTQSKLVHSEKMASLGTLVAGVAHEINNPINYAYLSSKVLEKDLDKFKEELMYLLDGTDHEVMNFFEEYFTRFSGSINNILEGSNQVKNIVQDLRLFSRLDEAVKKEIYVSEALETTIRLVKTEYAKQIEFTTNFHTDGKIECYPSQLNQVFLNIIVNACQAIMKKQKDLKDQTIGLVKISLLDNHKGILIVFNDTGCGMNEEVKSKIFEPFFTTKPIGQGTGLGMSISYGIIERHNGNIEVESQVGKGTTIIIFLPYEINSDQ
jgi:two-component system, NtrC family, sensor kinase